MHLAIQQYMARMQYMSATLIVHAKEVHGKGDHRHWGGEESPYDFTTLEALLADFEHGVSRFGGRDEGDY